MKPVSWKTLEFQKKNRHPDWVWGVGLISALSAIVSFFYGNIFFGIFLIVAGVVTIIYAFKDPKELEITISEKGISINGEDIEYKNINAFWLDETGKEAKLLLLVKGSFLPTLSFPLFGVSATEVREALAPNVKEQEMRESRSIALFDRLGF